MRPDEVAFIETRGRLREIPIEFAMRDSLNGRMT